jgi:hypothetical protein
MWVWGGGATPPPPPNKGASSLFLKKKKYEFSKLISLNFQIILAVKKDGPLNANPLITF